MPRRRCSACPSIVEANVLWKLLNAAAIKASTSESGAPLHKEGSSLQGWICVKYSELVEAAKDFYIVWGVPENFNQGHEGHSSQLYISSSWLYFASLEFFIDLYSFFLKTNSESATTIGPMLQVCRPHCWIGLWCGCLLGTKLRQTTLSVSSKLLWVTMSYPSHLFLFFPDVKSKPFLILCAVLPFPLQSVPRLNCMMFPGFVISNSFILMLSL